MNISPSPTSRICLGQYLPGQGQQAQTAAPRILCDARELQGHARQPWLRAYLAERLGTPIAAAKASGLPGSRDALVDGNLLSRHSLVCGATGSGKTRLALHLIGEQLRQGGSVVMLDPKADTLKHVMEMAYRAGMPAERVSLLSPARSGTSAPGWNPLDARSFGVSPVQAAMDFVSVLARSHSSWGPRLQDVLTNALILVSAHSLSLYELARLLQREDYRDGLVSLPLPALEPHDRIAYREAQDFFGQEFSHWSRSEQASAVGPVLNKFREFLRVPFLRALLCARRQTLDFAALWQKPGLVLVHLDAPSLGDEGARLLGGLLTHHLYRTALRVDGGVPVVLALDEMGVSEQFLGSALSQMLAIARSRGLRLLVACQHLAQLSEELRNALLGNCAVQAFFRLGYADAKVVAASLAAGTGEAISKLEIDVAKRDGDGNPAEYARWPHSVLDAYGQRLTLSAPAWAVLSDPQYRGQGTRQVEALKRLAAVSGMERLYVRAPDSKTPVEVSRYVQRLAPDAFWLEGPAPVRLVVVFPKPKVAGVLRTSESEKQQGWLKTLQDLPVRQAVLRLAAGAPGAVQVVAVPDAQFPAGMERFLSEAAARSGQTARDVETTELWRRETMEQVAGSGASQQQPESRPQVTTRAGKQISARKSAPAPSSRPNIASAPSLPRPKALPIPEDGSID